MIKGTQNADHGIRDALTLPHAFPHKLCPGSQRLDFARHPHFQTPLSSSPLPPFLFFSGTVPPIQSSSLSLSTLEKEQTTFLLYRMRARSLARPPTLFSPAPKLCFTFVGSRPTLSSKTKQKKASRVSACCSHHSVIITGKRRSACCDQSTIGGCGASAAHLTFNGHGDVATAMVGPINEDAQDDKGRCCCMALCRVVRSAATKQKGRESLRALRARPFPHPRSQFSLSFLDVTSKLGFGSPVHYISRCTLKKRLTGLPCYLGSFDTNFIIFRNVKFSNLFCSNKKKLCEGKC